MRNAEPHLTSYTRYYYLGIMGRGEAPPEWLLRAIALAGHTSGLGGGPHLRSPLQAVNGADGRNPVGKIIQTGEKYLVRNNWQGDHRG